MAKCKEYSALLDLFLREQFVTTCSAELRLFLREKVPQDIKEAVELTERYMEAHSGSVSGKYRTNPPKPKSPGDQKADGGNKDLKDQGRKENRCFMCHRKGHFACECKSVELRWVVRSPW